MFVGHAMVAFALVAGVARYCGRSPRRALVLGALAGAFATLPDVDIVYAVTGLLGATGPFAAADGFWASSTLVHRTATHSLLIGAVTAVGAAAWRHDGRTTAVAALLAFAGLVGVTTTVTGPVLGAITALFLAGALGLATVAKRLAVSPRTTGAVAAVGLLSHPFGDLFTGQPPALLYPSNVTLVTHRIVLNPNPTLHLLDAFWIELATIWLAFGVFLWLTGRQLRPHVDARATVGVAYAAAALLIPAPTLETSYQFVFSVLAVGAVGVTPDPIRRSTPDAVEVVATGLTAVTLASVAYAFAFVAA
ncbi:MAG: metal-dependent hydrolase [Haloarculaceae archaeon]